MASGSSNPSFSSYFQSNVSSPNFTSFQPSPPFHTSIGGYGSSGAFTLSQFMELQNQKLIYNYISANVTVPLHLLRPIFNSLYPPMKLDTSRQGYSDPHPERCRRTDGKKWRCAKDALTGHKYCERHMHRYRAKKKAQHQTNMVINSSSEQVPQGVSADSFVNDRSQRRSFFNLNEQEAQEQNLLHHFIDDWTPSDYSLMSSDSENQKLE
ncbi:growth-regulating factor 2-like [Euphorbia lathyris]|uniref:growth-regulating factor 2-like n=1 Tax=Euphorbia lathyris TaxID=212925 RepID=UPI003313DCFC